jgi:protoporphyrinogen/coproporphyrinogen III oxidase
VATPLTTILVIGGGISGLACAWRLRQHGLPVLLAERSERFGGLIDTVEKNGFHFDIGPQSFLGTGPVLDLVAELGLGADLVRADQRAPRYILHDKQLLRAPLGPGALLCTSLISRRTKLRLLGEALRHSYPPDGDESIAGFVRRKFGPDLLANLVGPFISGVYAGDPEKLSLESTFPAVRRLEDRYGSVLRGVIKSQRAGGAERASLCNFRRGMAALPAALAARLGDSARPGIEVAALRRRPAGEPPGFEAACREHGVTVSLAASAVVVATPTDAAARLLAGLNAKFGERLPQIEYAAVAEVATGYRDAQISNRKARPAAHGFGFLVPRTEGLRLLGTVWNSCLFPGRAPEVPEPMSSFTSFVGGSTDPEICARGEEEIAATVHAELASVLGIAGPPEVTHVARWERALPQYNLGHAQIREALKETCAAVPGVFLAGNYLAGPSIGSCIEQAGRTAEAVAAFLGQLA